jgi:integrase
MAKPHKLPSGSWRILISVGDGKRISYTADTKRACEQEQAKIQGGDDLSQVYESHKTLFSTFLENWFKTHSTNIRPNTRDNYRVMIDHYILPSLGQLKIKDITPSRLQALYDNLHREGIGARTLEITNAVVSGCLAHAERLELVTRNAARLVIVPEPEERPETIWNESQVSQFLAFVQGERNEMLYRLAFATGMRRNELLGLRWSDVDWLNGAIRVHLQIHELNGGGYTWAPVKSKSRNIQLGTGLLSYLKEQVEIVEAQRTLARARWKENDLVFPCTVGTPPTGSSLSKEFVRLELAAGLPRIRFHDIRHTFASIALMRNIPPATVAYILGDSLATVHKTYAHFIPGYESGLTELMDQVVVTTRIDELV